jgi:dehydrogenase/reductase SDR family member 12
MRRGTWSPAELRPMGGKVVLVTGATSGLGLAAAEGFARLGATVWLPARSEQRGELARAQILASSPDSDVRVDLCDLSDLESVRQFAGRFSAQTPRLDVLVNNAGALPVERTLSAGGIELTFATNVLGPFLLTNLLVPLLQKSKPARIVNVSSGGMYTQRIHPGDLQMGHEDFDGATAYARTKRAQVILTELWAEKLRGTGVVVHAMHPGWADTPGLKSSLPRFYGLTKRLLRTPQEGADTIVWLGAAPEPARSSGGFWHDRRQRPTHRVPWTRQTPEDREQLWAECERLSGWHETPTPANPDSSR